MKSLLSSSTHLIICKEILALFSSFPFYYVFLKNDHNVILLSVSESIIKTTDENWIYNFSAVNTGARTNNISIIAINLGVWIVFFAWFKLTLADHFLRYSSHRDSFLSTGEIKSIFLLTELASEPVTISNFTIQIQVLHYLHAVMSPRISETWI
jgi:hypothetical protein